jgi:hypothetical protein
MQASRSFAVSSGFPDLQPPSIGEAGAADDGFVSVAPAVAPDESPGDAGPTVLVTPLVVEAPAGDACDGSLAGALLPPHARKENETESVMSVVRMCIR